MPVRISGMAYSDVEHGLDNSDQWKASLYPSERDDDFGLFGKYIAEVIEKGDIANVTVGTYSSDTSPDPKEWLDTLKEVDCEDEPDEFERAGKRLAEKLNDVIHPTSNRGILFAVQATLTGETSPEDSNFDIAAVLKLDLNEEQRLKLREDKTLDTVDLEDVFPEPDELQKGLIYPVVRNSQFRLPGDVKFYQKDNVSGYFHEFVECDVEKASLEQAKSVFDAISDIKRERTGESANGDDLTRFKELDDEVDNDIADIDDIVSVASEIVGDEVTSDQLAEKLDIDAPETLAIDTKQIPSIVKYSIDSDIEVKFPSTAQNQVQTEEGPENVEITIRGDSLDTDALDK